jgi:hypothetical protein
MKVFKFFKGIIGESEYIYWSSEASGSLYGGPEYWSNYADEQELLRQQRIQHQREQTERMRNYITRSHNGRGRYPNPYTRR